jgi:hypothetical protein
MINLSSLKIDQFYLVTTTLHSSVLHDDFIVQYIFQLFGYSGSLKRIATSDRLRQKYLCKAKGDVSSLVIKGMILGLSRNIDLTLYTGFRITPSSDPLYENKDEKFQGLPSHSFFSIEEGAIDSIRLLEKKDGPLILNWFYLSEEIKKYLFNK